MAKKAAITASIILLAFMVFGSLIFTLFSITIEAFQIAGGLLVAKVGFDMLYHRPRQTEEEHQEAKKKDDVSLVPLAIPMLSGPGAITATLVWTAQAPSSLDKIALGGLIVIISIIAYVILISAHRLKKALGKSGTNVIERLMGLIVLVMGVQFILNALLKLIPSFIAG